MLRSFASVLFMLCLPMAIGWTNSGSLTPTPVEPYRYVYGVSTLTGYELHFVDPGHPDSPTLKQNVSVLSGMQVNEDVVPSPNGEWVTIGFSSLMTGQHNTFTKLLNVATGQLSDSIANGLPPTVLFYDSWDIFDPSIDVIWSPNSQYLAFDILDTAISPYVDIYLYSLTDHKLTDLTAADREQHYRMAWSSDSTQIATTAEVCTSPNACTFKLETFDLSGHITKIADISSLDAPMLVGGLAVCRLVWSPDSRHIAIVYKCSITADSKVYLWDMGDNSVDKIVDYGDHVAPFYTLIWYDAQSLIISAHYDDYAANPITFNNMQTVLFQVSTKSITVLSPSWISDWALNPIAGTFAFRYGLDFGSGQGGGAAIRRSPIQAATISGKTLSIQQTIVGSDSASSGYTCHLAWSPDYAYLVYVISGDCDRLPPNDHPIGYGFLKNGTLPISEHRLGVDEFPGNVVGEATIGWTVAPQAASP